VGKKKDLFCEVDLFSHDIQYFLTGSWRFIMIVMEKSRSRKNNDLIML